MLVGGRPGWQPPLGDSGIFRRLSHGCGFGNGSPFVGNLALSEASECNAPPGTVPGTVYDDIAGGGCIPVSQCHCKLQGQKYAPGQKITKDCEQWWVPGAGAGVQIVGGPGDLGWGPGSLGEVAGPDPGPHCLQRVQCRPLGVQRPAVPRVLCAGGRLPHHHL